MIGPVRSLASPDSRKPYWPGFPICVWVSVYTFLYICTYIQMYMRIHNHLYIHTYVYIKTPPPSKTHVQQKPMFNRNTTSVLLSEENSGHVFLLEDLRGFRISSF